MFIDTSWHHGSPPTGGQCVMAFAKRWSIDEHIALLTEGVFCRLPSLQTWPS